MNRKGQLGGLTTSIMALVVGIIVLVVGLVIIQEIRDTKVVTESVSATASQEVLTTVTEVSERFAQAENCGVTCGTVSGVINSSSNTDIPTTNYTQTGCTIVWSGAGTDDPLFNNTNWNITYSYTYGDEACLAGNESLAGLGDFADFVPIIVIAVAASVIIGLILSGFAFSRRSR